MKIKELLGHWGFRIAALYTGFVLLMIGFVVVANFFPFNLVAKDYYNQDVKYQQQIDKINRTKALPKQVTCEYDHRRHQISVQFPEFVKEAEGRIVLFRPSDSTYDRTFPLKLNANNQQTIDAATLLKGMWRVKIEWKTAGIEYYNEAVIIIE